jgi:hypothetical protein
LAPVPPGSCRGAIATRSTLRGRKGAAPPKFFEGLANSKTILLNGEDHDVFGDAPSMSGAGPVSRVTPVHTALRNCTRDEGRSFEFGNQVLISNRRKLLWSKAMVVNVAEKPEQDSGRYD